MEASKRAFRRWDARLTLAVWRATAARAAGPGVRVTKNRESRRKGATLFPAMGVFALPSPFFRNVQCVRETEVPVEQQPPQGVLVYDHAGLGINKFSSLTEQPRFP